MSGNTDIPASSHPSAADFANMAAERLGKKKYDRIIEHCKNCPECADKLLQAVRDAPMERQPLKLSKWNWISIGLLVISLAAVFAALVWFLGGAAGQAVPGR